jgi:hypothetical protein
VSRSQTLLMILLASIAYLSAPASAQIAVRNQGYIPFSDPPINYRSNDLSDPVAKLQQQLERGKASLVYEPEHGYLRSVLQLLQVPVDSQTLVFSKTSFQYPKISPEHPRALYFNDDVYVGSVHEGKAIEIVSFDPRQGAIFYLLDEHKVDHPVFQRAELDCTQCHIAAGTRGVPGVLLRSVYPTTTGTLVPGTRSLITDQESPLSERWGGWYVTGDLAGAAHMGNAVVPDKQPVSTPDGVPPPAGNGSSGETPTGGSPPRGSSTGSTPTGVPSTGTQLEALAKPFDASTYLSRDSDVVAHLVLAHQTQMHNLITLTNYKTRLALYSQTDPAANPGGTPAADATDAPIPEATRRQFERPAEQLLRYMLFSKQAPLPGDGQHRIGATSAFAREFAARGPRDSQGRSLRDLDLTTKLFRYPCSYLIYSESFDALPQPAKEYLYHRLLEVLTGKDQSPDFAGLSTTDRRAILEILLATKPGLPQEWQAYAASNHLDVAPESASSPRQASNLLHTTTPLLQTTTQ